LEDLADSLAEHKVEVEGRVVTSITGYALCDTIEELEVDLLVVKAKPDGSLPIHMDWLYQVIPTRLLRVRESRKQTADEYSAGAPKRVFRPVMTAIGTS
jgi:hypothetical protein